MGRAAARHGDGPCARSLSRPGSGSMAGYLRFCDADALTLELGARSLLDVVKECRVMAGPVRGSHRYSWGDFEDIAASALTA